MTKHSIELNGKLYDAITGALIGPVGQESAPKAAAVTHVAVSSHAASSAPALPKAQKTTDRSHHLTQTKPTSARKPEHSKTLIRRAVSKPNKHALPVVKRHYPVQSGSQAVVVPVKQSAHTVNDARLKRAQAVHKNASVKRFSPAQQGVAVSIKPLAVHPAPIHLQQTATKIVAPILKPAANIFEQALIDAKSHEQEFFKPLKTKRRSWRRGFLNASAAVLAVLVIGGFVAYMNRTALQLEMASVRAGFQASMPGYAPNGFAAQTPIGEQGKVQISFVSPASNESFTLIQESSKWDSQELFDDIASKHRTAYQTIQSGGRTIYLYGDSQASWVDGGIRYTVEGNAQLAGNQLISLATSL